MCKSVAVGAAAAWRTVEVYNAGVSRGSLRSHKTLNAGSRELGSHGRYVSQGSEVVPLQVPGGFGS